MCFSKHEDLIYSVSQKWYLQIFKYISSWDNIDKMTLWHNEK